MRYRVHRQRTMVESIEVEASSKAEAKRKADEAAEAGAHLDKRVGWPTNWYEPREVL